MSSAIGLTVPKLLPIAGTWLVPFAAYNFLLSFRVVGVRLSSDTYIGDKLAASKNKPSNASADAKPPRDQLEIASRCHANFLENIPLAFIFLTVCELNGGDRKVLNYIMTALFALRIAHAEAGLLLEGKFGDSGIGRPVGYFGSLGVLGALAGYSAYLVKGYWRF